MRGENSPPLVNLDGQPTIDAMGGRLCDRLGIEAPILQAPIGSASGPDLVAAVSNAGGLGMLAGTWRRMEDLRAAIRMIRAKTDRPFAVNLGVHADPEEKIALCVAERVPIVSLFWGDGRKYYGAIQRGGAKVLATIGTPREAVAAAEAEADVIIAQGMEAGGHVWGKMNGHALLKEVVEVVERTPVVLAGGVGEGRSMAAAMQSGADGVCVGTRFILAEESLAHPTYQEHVIRARREDTFYGEVFEGGWTNAPHRVIRNSVVEAFEREGRSGIDEVVATDSEGMEIRRYSSRLPVRGMSGRIEMMAMYAGCSIDACNRIEPAARIIRELMKASEV